MNSPATKSFLQDWTLTIPSRDGRQPRMVGALRRLEATLGHVQGQMPSVQNAKESLRAVEEGWGRGLRVTSLPRRHLRQFAWALFQPWAREGRDLPGDDRFVAAYREWLTTARSGTRVARLIPPYLRHFPEDEAFREDWRRFFAPVLGQASGRRLVVWKERDRKFGLLAADGPQRFAQMLMDHPDRYDELLDQAGLTGFLTDSRFVRVAHWALLHQISQRFLRTPHLTRSQCESLLSALESSPGKLRFQDLRVDIAKALLSPWLERTPAEPVKQAIRGFLQRTLGNPNIRRGRWSGVPSPIRQVILRWLAEEALEAFFQILSETAMPRHWEERKPFWSAYLDAGMLSDAWLALGPKARSLANTAFQVPSGAWARLRGGQATHSVLLLRIQNLTVLEWSHEGAGRIWLDGHPNAPKLYQEYYRSNQLLRPCDYRFVHRGPWQRKTARWIQRETGLRPGRLGHPR